MCLVVYEKKLFFCFMVWIIQTYYHINVQFYILLCMSMLILQFWNYIFTHVMVKSIFLEKKYWAKKRRHSSVFHLPNFFLMLQSKMSIELFSHEFFLSSVSNNRRGQLREECELVACSRPSLGPAHFTQHMSESESEKSVSIYQSTK